MATSKPTLARGEDLRRQKELDEARKAGLAPAAVDEHGKEINPHIPQYMASAPWYAVDDASKPTLRHQRDWRQDEEAGGAGGAGAAGAPGQPPGQWYDRGAKTFQATKYRKGACENCGAMTHKTSDCLERPRARGARWTDKHIAADEKVQEVKLAGWDAKRDRWNGYDPSEHDRVVQRYERVEALRQEARAQQRLAALVGGVDGEEGGDGGGAGGGSGGGAGGGAAAAAGTSAAAAAAADGSQPGTFAAAAADDVRLADEEALGFGAVERRVAAPGGGATGSVRNLRIREDTAKYLLNLDVNSAHYDPKTRSMREDPLPHKPAHEKPFAGDNFVRTSGAEYEAWAALERHALQAYEKGAEVHAQALPSLAETMYASFKAKKEALARKQRSDVRERYGSAAANPAEDLPEGAAAADPETRRALLMGATEAYVEYDPRTGRVVRGAERPVARSRYEEDVHPGNHTSVWGSWWSADQGWGYACCRQHLRNSYCTGAEGAKAAEQGAEQMARNLAAKAREEHKRAEAERRAKSTLSNAHLEQKKEGRGGGDGLWGGEAPTGEGELELDPEKLQRALEREDRRAAKAEARAAKEAAAEEQGRPSRAEEREKLLRKRRGEAGGSDGSDDSDDELRGEGRTMTKEEMEAYRRKRARPDDPMMKGGGGEGGYDLLE